MIGSFVEVTRSKIGKKVLMKHLAYVGDAAIGDGTNVGAGTITANFDGRRKHKTRIGKKVLILNRVNNEYASEKTRNDRIFV